MKPKELGEILQWCRLQKGWKQDVLADLLGVQRSYISKHESGEYLNLNILKQWGNVTGYETIVNRAVAEYLGDPESQADKYMQYEMIFQRFQALQADLQAIS